MTAVLIQKIKLRVYNKSFISCTLGQSINIGVKTSKNIGWVQEIQKCFLFRGSQQLAKKEESKHEQYFFSSASANRKPTFYQGCLCECMFGRESYLKNFSFGSLPLGILFCLDVPEVSLVSEPEAGYCILMIYSNIRIQCKVNRKALSDLEGAPAARPHSCRLQLSVS